MKLKKYQSLFFLTLYFGLSFVIHKYIFNYLEYNSPKSIYTLEFLYLFFGISSVVIITVLIKVKEKNLDIVGNTFLLLTTIKMMLSYIMVRPILNQIPLNNSEKWNFFFLFIYFLMVETIITINLLNKKD
jgi:uncharacterized membrane protein